MTFSNVCNIEKKIIIKNYRTKKKKNKVKI